ncbi:MAG: bi-domain-containing oxidoreductase [Elusimicrobia bacterium]|nr:bi-domain-containing oxidoreductase [Elusimicrobiota bacterium]
MKQVLLRKGKITVSEVPAPALSSKNILVEVSHSLISTGTELSTVQLSGASLLDKAKARPAEALKVFHSLKVRGIRRTLEIVQGRLDELKPLGYSCAGTVIAVGSDVSTFQAGDRVACAGAGIANHAEVVSVPVNLATKIPSGLDGSAAAFVTLGSIAMQGVRRADVRLGESVCVIGLGLLGQLTVQLLAAAGCRVFGMDTDAARVELARSLGLTGGDSSADSLKSILTQATAGQGADATIITASTGSSDPTRLAFHLTRKKGRIVVVGAVGLELERSPFYEKEQDFLISCSYGPGRYDASYEAGGQDYPFAYVRWTENRNMASFLELLAEGRLKTGPLVGKTFPVSQAEEAYRLLQESETKPLAVLLTYPSGESARKTAPVVTAGAARKAPIRLGLIGAGNFAKTMHLPNLRALEKKVQISAVCAATAGTAATIARQVGAAATATDHRELLKDPAIDAVLISTRHDTHAAMTAEALRVGKNVFVEKPIALTTAEAAMLDQTIRGLSKAPVLMVGFNRRFAPTARSLFKETSKRVAPLVGTYRVNAGAMPPGHWTNGPQGGGRLRGEACHMVDFFQALVGKPIEQASLAALRPGNAPARPDENFAAHFVFEDGSLCDLVYTSLGSPALAKERVEVHWDGRSAVLDDFKSLSFAGGATTSGTQDKGHLAALDAFLDAIIQGGASPISWDELHASAQIAVELDAMAWGKADTVS